MPLFQKTMYVFQNAKVPNPFKLLEIILLMFAHLVV